MPAVQQSTVTSLVHARAAQRAGRQGQYTLDGLYEICAFLTAEIQASKRRYSDIARRAGCCPSTVSNLASGQTKNPSSSTLVGILQALGFRLIADTDDGDVKLHGARH